MVMTTTRSTSGPLETASVLLPPDAGRGLQFGPGEHIVWKVTGAPTAELFDFCELTAAPQAGPPQHIHALHDEAFYIREGAFRMQGGTQRQVATAGAFVFIARGTVHAWQNIGSAPGHLLTLFTPGEWRAILRG